MRFSKKDLVFSIITGLITGFIAWWIFEFLNLPEIVYGQVFCITTPCVSPYTISWAWLVLVVPVLWILGVRLGYFLGKWIGFFNQFGKFAAIGFTNAAVDFGILNLLIAKTGETAGLMYAMFKGLSFIAATTHSYVWNKYWAFNSGNSSGQAEFIKFFSVSLLALAVNVGIASSVVNFVPPIFGFDDRIWANVGAVAGSAFALVFSFVGFKMVVFKK